MLYVRCHFNVSIEYEIFKPVSDLDQMNIEVTEHVKQQAYIIDIHVSVFNFFVFKCQPYCICVISLNML